ncbi:MAG: phage major capsid protein [Alphaproteobacteria bacterium]|nr:phage major capsid protein [Alphaproteobacteria bacterium]
MGWVAETGAREETAAPELAKLTIGTHEMFARPRASQKLLDDVSVDLEHWLVQKIAWQMGLMETGAFVSGDGKGKPRGFLSYPIAVMGKPEWGKVETLQSGSEGGLEDSDVLVDVFHSLKPEYLSGACWVMARSTLSQIRKLKDKDGQYLWMPHMSEGVASTLLGYPVIICDSMPGLIKDGLSVAFGNFNHAYQIVERQDIQLLRDPYSAKPYVEFYATKRVGGDVVNFDALRLIQLSE